MDNYIEYIATGKCNSFQNIFYTTDVADITVTINSIEIATTDYTWVYGSKFVQFDTVPEDQDRVRITNDNMAEEDTDLEILRNDVSSNTANITAIEAEQITQDAVTAINATDIVALEAADLVHDTSINNLSTDYAVHEARLDAFDISTVSTEAKAQQNLEDIALLSDQSGEISDLDNRMLAAEAAIVVIQGNEVDTEQALSDLEDDVALLNAVMSGGDVAIGSHEILNNVTIASELTNSDNGSNLVIDAQYCHAATLTVILKRDDDTEARHTVAELLFLYDVLTDLWSMDRIETVASSGNSDGVTFSMTTHPTNYTADVFYISDNMVGANYSGLMTFKLVKIPHTF